MHISIEPYVDIVGVTGSIPVTPTISSSKKFHEYSEILGRTASIAALKIKLK